MKFRKIQQKYGMELPAYPGTDQIVELERARL